MIATATLTRLPGDWVLEAACAGEPVEVFFGGDRQPLEQWVPRAKEICQRCPVRPECLEHALRTRETEGVWGGTGPEERLRFLQSRW